MGPWLTMLRERSRPVDARVVEDDDDEDPELTEESAELAWTSDELNERPDTEHEETLTSTPSTCRYLSVRNTWWMD